MIKVFLDQMPIKIIWSKRTKRKKSIDIRHLMFFLIPKQEWKACDINWFEARKCWFPAYGWWSCLLVALPWRRNIIHHHKVLIVATSVLHAIRVLALIYVYSCIHKYMCIYIYIMDNLKYSGSRMPGPLGPPARGSKVLLLFILDPFPHFSPYHFWPPWLPMHIIDIIIVLVRAAAHAAHHFSPTQKISTSQARRTPN